MPHAHGSAAAANRGRLVAVLGLSLVMLIVEAVGALASNSLALLADAGHMLTDVSGIGLALLAIWFAGRAPTTDRTFGYLRLGIRPFSSRPRTADGSNSGATPDDAARSLMS